MAIEATSNDLVQVVTLLTAAVVAVPLFKKFGLGSVLGYLSAGLVIGPWGLKLFTNPNAILHVAELGVVMFLFVIGLEMRPLHLWGMRRDIFGLGTLQILACTTLLSLIGVALGLSPLYSFVGCMGFVLTSTAVVMQLLKERGELGLPKGQKIVAVLLFEDLLIVPLLALMVFLSPETGEVTVSYWASMGIAIGAVGLLVAAGIWLLNPFFRLLAAAGAREVLTAAALLVVLGAALLMQMSGLSMAMGAFLAGVLLAESSFRHQIEADIEPFRGILLGLFFIGVGMSLDLGLVLGSWRNILIFVMLLMVGKAVSIYLIARVTKSDHHVAIERALLMAQGGEFAFVLYAAAAHEGLIPAEINAQFTAIVVLSMALTPLVVVVAKPFLKKFGCVYRGRRSSSKPFKLCAVDWLWSFWSSRQSTFAGEEFRHHNY
ncbi:MAG: cation:proton antiporter [Bdellovibrionaceae bacterium]|nr:cation:proton antiporter [Pseudobdellovibrionaceae bacterium]